MGKLLPIDDNLKAVHLRRLKVDKDSMGHHKNPNDDPENRGRRIKPLDVCCPPHKSLHLTDMVKEFAL